MKPHRLSIGEIHVWTAPLADDTETAADLLRILGEEERARAAQLAFEHDRVRFIQAHGAVRQILADYCGADAATLTFDRGQNGKPYLVPRPGGPNLQFSVSHSGECCMLAVRLDHAIGIDIEKIRDLPQVMAIARRYFEPAEGRRLDALQGTARRDAFFVLWTHKEAMAKGLGVPLAANLDRIEFEFDPINGVRFLGWRDNRYVAEEWSVFRLDPEAGYVAAVAAEHPVRSLTLQRWPRSGAD
jgi:4'-phosphopantetheinyl transferase